MHRRGRGVACCVATEAGRQIHIRGEREHLARRVLDFLKREARRDIEAAVKRHAAAIGREPTKIRIGDAKTRWGSCNSRGSLTFSWRLILAPVYVLDYLAAHEVAHLKEMNHGPRFWNLVARLDPDYERAQTWLRQYGAELHAVGRSR
jgi:predicted metal-dependent hydrolase